MTAAIVTPQGMKVKNTNLLLAALYIGPNYASLFCLSGVGVPDRAEKIKDQAAEAWLFM
jgi:hypothetical protein